MFRGPDTRMRLVTGILVMLTIFLVGQLFRLQILDHKVHAERVAGMVRQNYELPEPPQGVITDRNGDLLVGNMPVAQIDVQAGVITDTAPIAETLAQIPGLDPALIVEALKSDDDYWHRLNLDLDPQATDQLESLIQEEQWRWITISEGWKRYYPEGDLASHLLGFVNQDGEGVGLEAYQQRFLQPQPVEASGELLQMIPVPEAWTEKPLRSYRGTNIKLTLDRTIQAYVEDELARALQDHQAVGGTILVMNPETGEILASASSPDYRPGDYQRYYAMGQEEIFKDPLISVDYEPGSVFKVITVAAALDSGSATLDWSYVDTGLYEYGGAPIQNAMNRSYGHQSLQGVLDHSLNVGVARLTTQAMGKEIFYDYVSKFGFGQTMRIGLKNEIRGVLHFPNDMDWSDSNLATNAFGQGISVTPLQLASAISAIANDGVIMYPHVVAERHYADGRRIPATLREMRKPISAETAHTVAAMMQHVIDHQIETAQVPGYPVAGKTGTAQIPVTGGYDREDVITSFVGFGPMPDPKVLILVKLNRPGVDPSVRWGTTTAAPVFSTVAARVFQLLGIPPVDAVAAQ